MGITTEKSQTNQQINSIILNNKKNIYYLYFAIKDYFKNFFGVKKGNIFANMNKKDFSNIRLLYNQNIAENYYCLVQNMFNKIKNNIFQNQELAYLRDFLLPFLMNGQVTFK